MRTVFACTYDPVVAAAGREVQSSRFGKKESRPGSTPDHSHTTTLGQPVVFTKNMPGADSRHRLSLII
jgi:hypothetical protein